MIGKTISHYKILDKLGSGGMGVVYKAEDTKLGRKVALKFLPQYVSADSETKARFEIEARAAAALNHPNIATIYSIEESGDQVFISMEYIKGKELKDIIVETRDRVSLQKEEVKENVGSGHALTLQKNEVIKIAIQIAEGLEAAHKEGITHRDIKTSNLMITEGGIVKIMDFGLAKVKGGSKVTQMGSTVGTVAYMSPEQSRGEEVDNRTDIWSFGVVLYEMLTGKMPFRGDYNQAVIYSIMNENPEPLRSLRNGIPLKLESIINKMLAKNPDERYQSAGEIIEELNKIKNSKDTKQAGKKTKLPWMITAAAAIIIAAGIYLYVPSSNTVKQTEAIKTIAVLPFTDMSPNKDQEYFSDGIAVELINTLSRNPKLRVTARPSSFYFKGTRTDIKAIAQRLNVKHILEGSVRKFGNNLRISADLVNAETEATLWSNTYNGTMSNIFALQDSISGNVAEALNAALLGKGAPRPEQKTDPEAYNNYLLGNHFCEIRDKENLEKAEGYFEKAISIDSNYAPAWVGLSQVHRKIVSYSTSMVVAFEFYGKARKEAEKALRLNPNFADAYAMIGYIKRTAEWDWTGADKAFKKGMELEPDNTNVLTGAAYLAFTLGRLDEAIKLIRRVIEIDPVIDDGYGRLGLFAWYAGLTEESISACRKALELRPKSWAAHYIIASVYLDKGKPDSALVEIRKEPEPFYQTQGLAIVYYALGRKKEADEKLQEYIKEYQNTWAYLTAEIYAYRNERDKAFEWLERAYNQRDTDIAWMVGDPLLRNIVKDPRYAAFMKKMNLPL